EMIYFQVLGRMPTPAQTAVVDGCLVTLMEHGLTPTALATRLVYTSATEAMQGAVAAGLMGVGSLFVGAMEGCAELLERMLGSHEGLEAEALRIAEEHRGSDSPVPGFGHPLHKPDDPRSVRLFELARSQGIAGRHTQAIQTLSRAVDDTHGKHITVNVTGAIAAVLGDCGVPARIMRGFAIISRCAGLVGHVHEEQRKPAMRAIWEAAERAVPYDGTAGR
ncbi:MAG: citryl-CoA lyase, partial [Nitrospiraceae bacterium]